MAIVVTWRQGKDPWTWGIGGNLSFYVEGTADENDAIEAAFDSTDCGATHQGIPRQDLSASAKPWAKVNAENPDGSSWIVTVPYSAAAGSFASNETYWRLASVQASGRLIQAVTGSSVQYDAAGETMPELNGYIGVDLTGQRTPTGVSLGASAFAVSGSWVKSAGSVDAAYLQSLVQLSANPVNSDTWNVEIAGVSTSFAAGECRIDYLETPQAPRADGKLQFSATILVSPNITAGTVFGVAGVDKLGWQYAEPYYEPISSGTFLVPKALGVSISTVYGTSSYGPIDGGV